MIPILENTLAARSLTFGYANARVKAMKKGLLQEKEFKAMIEARNVQEVYSILEKTDYRQDLVSSALKENTLADQIELATTKNFSRTLKKIVKMSPEKFREKIAQLFEKYDINNIKTILTSKHLGQPKEKIDQFIIDPTAMKSTTLNKCLAAKSMEEAVRALDSTKYGELLEKNYKQYQKDKQITGLLAPLDNRYYKELPQIAKNSFGDERFIVTMFKAQTDAKNISNICRSIKSGIGEEERRTLIANEGNIKKEHLEKAIKAKTVEEVEKICKAEINLGKAIEEYKKTGSLIPLEIELEKNIAKKGLHVLRSSILSIGTIVGFLILKEIEIDNIRKIIRAKEFNLPKEKLQEMIVEAY